MARVKPNDNLLFDDNRGLQIALFCPKEMKNLRFSQNWGAFASGSKLVALLLAIIGTVLTMLVPSDAYGQAPDFRWVKTAGGYNSSGGDAAYGTAVDSSGNVSVVGRFSSQSPTFMGSDLTNNFSSGGFIAKFDSEGRLLWAKSIGTNSNFNAIATDSQGNIYAAGSINYSNTFGNVTLTNNQMYGAALLVKYDRDGNALWATQSLNATFSRIAAISLDPTGNPCITGIYYTTSNMFLGSEVLTNSGSYIPGVTYTYDVFVAKFTPSGQALWARQIAGLDEESGSMIAADAAGNVILGAPYPSYADFASVRLNGLGEDDFCLAKYGPDGNLLWAKPAASGRFGYSQHVAADPMGNLYIGSFFSSETAEFDNITLTNVGGQAEIVLAKYDQNGNFLWVRPGTPSGGMNSVGGLCVDAMGNSYFAGSFTFTNLVFGNVEIPRSPHGGDSLFVVKHDSAGNLLWAKTPADADAHPVAISVDKLGNLYVVGNMSTGVFDFGSFTVTNNFPSAAFVARLDGPKLSIHPAGNQLTLSWPTNAVGLHPESATSLSLGDWSSSSITNAPCIIGDQNTVTLDSTTGSRFFRLNGP
jgi:hypothetical protein